MIRNAQKITRRGIKVHGKEYWDATMVLFHMGEKVNVEIDEGIIRVFNQDGLPITTFECE